MQVWLVDTRLMRARVALARGLAREAEEALRSAWALAETLGRYRDFRDLEDLGGGLLELFRQIVDINTLPEPVRRLIFAECPAPQQPAPTAGEASDDHAAVKSLTAADGSTGQAEAPPERRPEAESLTMIDGSSGQADDAPASPVGGSVPGAPREILLVERLSERELEVLRLIALGLPNREIGRHLHVEIQTVKFHAGNIYGKLGVENRIQAVRRARELGLLGPGV